MKDFVRRGRSNSSAADLAPCTHSATSPRMSILPSVKLPSLRRLDGGEPPAHQKAPMLTLTLSSLSFLDSSVDDATTKQSLYKIKTVGTSTTVSRKDLREGSVTTASIKWPRMLPLKTKGKEYNDDVLIQMRGARWHGRETLLKPGTNPSSSSKFNIPNYSQPMKWKRYGKTYWCTTPSVKGPIAILDLTKGEDPTKLTVYETLHDKYDPKLLSTVQGVSILLLDYLLVTALLLVTDLQEWMVVRKFEGQNLTIPHPPDPSGQGPGSAASDPQWRKIMYGEPIYPKLSEEARSRHSGTSLSSPTTPALPRTPTSAGAIPHFTYVESETSSSRYSSRKMMIASAVDEDEDSDDDEELFALEETRPPSPSAESVHFSGIAPSHTHIDPSFYDGSQNRPSTSSHAKSLNGRNFSSQPSTPVSGSFRPFRELPHPPIPQMIARPRSSPPLESTHDDQILSFTHGQVPSASSVRSDSIRSSASYVSRAGSSTSRRRPLPRPPPVPPIDPSPPVVQVRRVQSSNQLQLSSLSRGIPPRPQRSLPPTPNDGHIAAVSEADADDTDSDDNDNDDPTRVTQGHSRQPPITKASQEDMTQWVHLLTSPQRDLPPAPLPTTSIFDVPPPAYSSISFSRSSSQNRPPVPVTYPKVDTSS